MAAAALLHGAAVRAAEVVFEGSRFDPVRTVDGQALRFSGAGKRTILFLDAYHAALYTPVRLSSFDALRKLDGPRVIELRLLRDAPLLLLERVISDGVRRNTEPDRMPGLQERLHVLFETMRSAKSLMKGDVLEIVFSGGSTQLQLNRREVGAPIPGKDFNDALMSIWLGPEPIDAALKQHLLGDR